MYLYKIIINNKGEKIMKKQNVRIAKELIKIAKSLIADFEWNEYAIYECRKQFEKDLQD